MSEKITKKMPMGYAVLWGIMIAAYLVWMIFFLHSDTYPASETGMTNPAFYPMWTVVSGGFMALFMFYIKSLIFGKEPGKGLKLFCLINLIFGCVFITWYGFFKDPQEFTASMIGLEYPWHFKMWGVFASMSVFSNTMLMYRKHNFYSKAGIVLGSIGSAAIFVTINVPSAGEDLILNSLRCMSHWTGALVFAFFVAASIVLFMLGKLKTKNKALTALFVVYAAVLALMIVLLVVIGKDGVIESLPMWATYIVLFLANFTSLFDEKEVSGASREKEPVKVK